MLRKRFDEKASRRANMYRNAYTRFREDDDIDEGDEEVEDEGSDTVTLEVPADKAEAIKQLLDLEGGDEGLDDEGGEEEEIEEDEEMSESLKRSIARIRAKRVAEARRKEIMARRQRMSEARANARRSPRAGRRVVSRTC